MISMYFINRTFFFLFVALLTSISTYAQMQAEGVNDGAQNTGEDADFNLFVNKFENMNVGNLHLYVKPKATLEANYFFKGKALSKEDRKYLPLDLQRKMIIDEQPIYAVGSIRHDGDDNFGNNDLYIIRMDAKKSPDQLMLLELEDGQLVSRRILAYNKKVWGGYLQMDTWIQDVNGDTFLDLIQKGRKVTKRGKVKKEKTKVFLMQPDGDFVEGSTELINTDDYLFEDIIK